MKQTYIWLLLAALTTLASCTQEFSVNNEKDTSELPEGATLLKLNFGNLSKPAKSYANGTLPGSDAENRIDSVFLFFFDEEKEDLLVNVHKLKASGDGPGGLESENVTVLVVDKSNKMNIVAITNPQDSLIKQNWINDIGVMTFTSLGN